MPREVPAIEQLQEYSGLPFLQSHLPVVVHGADSHARIIKWCHNLSLRDGFLSKKIKSQISSAKKAFPVFEKAVAGGI